MDCAALTETWLYGDDRDNAVKSQLVPAGYKFLHVARSGSRGGGVAVVCKEQYGLKLDNPFQADSFETMSVLTNCGFTGFPRSSHISRASVQAEQDPEVQVSGGVC